MGSENRVPHGLSPRMATIVATGLVFQDRRQQAMYDLRRACALTENELTGADRALMNCWRATIGFEMDLAAD